MQKIQNKFKVVTNKKVCERFFRLSFDAKSIRTSIHPGQFLHIRVSGSFVPFFRRPFSVFRAKSHVEILYEVVGTGTKILSEKKCGDSLDVIGPLGKGFSTPPAGIKQIVMIAGGVGIAPFLILSDVLAKKKYELVLLYGARTKDHVFDMKEFKANGCKVFISTDDGSIGKKGRVPELYSEINPDRETTMLYACGPKPMLASVQRYALKNDLRCEASFEEVMACGLGACLGCSIKTTSGYKTVCHDGPVFDIRELVFE